MNRIAVLLAVSFGLLLSAGPSFSQGGYPPGPTTTSTVLGGPGGEQGGPIADPGAAPGTPAAAAPLVLADSPPPAAAVAPASAPRARFAVTGANAARLAAIALVLVMAGAVLVTTAGRRRARVG